MSGCWVPPQGQLHFRDRDAGVIPAAGCFQRAVMGSPGPLFPFPSWWSHGQRLRQLVGTGVQGSAPHTCILPAAGEGLSVVQHRQVPADSRAVSFPSVGRRGQGRQLGHKVPLIITSLFSFSLACLLLGGIMVGKVYVGLPAARLGLKGAAGDTRCPRMPPIPGSHG